MRPCNTGRDAADRDSACVMRGGKHGSPALDASEKNTRMFQDSASDGSLSDGSTCSGSAKTNTGHSPIFPNDASVEENLDQCSDGNPDGDARPLPSKWQGSFRRTSSRSLSPAELLDPGDAQDDGMQVGRPRSSSPRPRPCADVAAVDELRVWLRKRRWAEEADALTGHYLHTVMTATKDGKQRTFEYAALKIEKSLQWRRDCAASAISHADVAGALAPNHMWWEVSGSEGQQGFSAGWEKWRAVYEEDGSFPLASSLCLQMQRIVLASTDPPPHSFTCSSRHVTSFSSLHIT